MTRALPLVALLACSACWSAPAPPDDLAADAAIQIEATSLSAGVGYTWGGGTLTYRGKSYPIEMDGLLVAAVGISTLDATGRVFYLGTLDDFDGNYTAKSGASAIGEGGAGVVMRNQHGVEVRMIARHTGVTLSIGATGVTLALKK